VFALIIPPNKSGSNSTWRWIYWVGIVAVLKTFTIESSWKYSNCVA